MEGLFPRPAFTEFGPSLVAPPGTSAPLWQVEHRRASGLRAGVREMAPRRPGVYGMVDGDGRLVYVGKAKSLRARLLSYFRPHSRDRKAATIIRHSRALVWEVGPSEFAALLRELELIRRWRPRFNVLGQPHRHRRTYVCVGRRPAPHVFLAARPPAGVLACYGPVPVGARAREAVRRLNDAFGLRDCPLKQLMVFADQGEFFPQVRAAGCIRHEIGTCLGPCAAACTRAAYGQRVAAVQAFLEGRDTVLLAALRGEMDGASAGLQFERAAVLRDKLDVLERLEGQLRRLREARHEQSFVYPVAGEGSTELWYLIRQGRVVRAVQGPACPARGRVARNAVREVFGREVPPGGTAGASEIDGVLLVASWFRQHPEERGRALTPLQAEAACRAAARATAQGG